MLARENVYPMQEIRLSRELFLSPSSRILKVIINKSSINFINFNVDLSKTLIEPFSFFSF